MFKTVSKPLAHLNFLSGVNCYDIGSNKNETRIDLPAIAAIVSNKADTSDFRDSNSSMAHALSFLPGGEV